MEPPLKRRRLSNPDAGLSERRARNDFRLKSIFESIFEKYGRDFDGIGDEIDMNTGEIVVNNGHILSMRNERDAGDIQSLDDELESIYSSGDDQETVELHDQGQEFLADPSEVQNTVLASALESVDLIENGDNVIGDVDELETPEMEPVRITRRILATQDLEEDELASNEFDWLSPRKLRSIAQDRWRLHELETVEREATEPVWRAPPLPDRKPLHRQIPKHSDVLFEHTQNHPDSEDLGISIWALGESTSLRTKSLVALRDSSSPAMQVKSVPWTQEEDDLLRHLKSTTNLTGRAIEPYFPLRNSNTIAVHWYTIRNRDKSRQRTRILAAEQKMSSSPLPPNLRSAQENAPNGFHVHDSEDSSRYARLTEQPSMAPIPALDNVLDGLSESIEKAFIYRQDNLYDVAEDIHIKRNPLTINAVADHLGNWPPLIPPLRTVQPSCSDRSSPSSIRCGTHESRGHNLSLSSPYHPSNDTKGTDLGYDLSDSSKQHNLSGDHLGQSVSSTGASLHTVEVDTATRRNWCIERFRQVGISATSPKIAFHANESTGYNVKDELPQTTTIDLSSSRASSETKASRNHVIEMTTVPDTLQTPESGLATSQDARSIPILAEDQDHDQSLATTLSDPQHTFLQSELEPIYVPSTQICPGVKVVIPLAARINVPEEVSAVLEVKASQDSLEDLCDKIEVESSIRETVDQYFCADGESTMNMRLPIPVQPDPGGSSATVFDSSTESEDELAKPVVHSRITYSARQPHKNSSAVLEVPDSQPTPDIQPKRIMYFSTTGKFSDRLPLRGPRSQNKRNLKTVKTEIADSFDSMSTAADDDCSEDELA